jgi:hypothetical protein
MRELNENEVILDKDEYRYLKDMADRYDPFWFCTFGGCEGVCKECKDTCEMSIFVKERKETATTIINWFLSKGCFTTEELVDFAKQFGCEIGIKE